MRLSRFAVDAHDAAMTNPVPGNERSRAVAGDVDWTGFEEPG